MIDYTIYHEGKSKFAYIYDKDTVHLKVIASKDKVKSIRVIYGDPFNWGPDENDKWTWLIDSSEDSYLEKEYQTEQFDHFFIEARPTFKRMRYAFIINEKYLYGSREIIDLEKQPKLLKDHFNYFNFPFLNEEDIFNAPSWVENQTWYSIFPERFSNGDPSINTPDTLKWGDTKEYSNHQRFGGDLQGIIDKLDYIKASGFTGIYMTPIFKSDSTHKYDVNDYSKIDQAFGTNELFGELVEKAHKQGLKVMLDAVYNHCGFRHPFFQDVVEKGKDSPYYDCFYIIDKDKPVINFELNEDKTINRESAKKIFKDHRLLNYRTFAFTPYMPKMNTNHPLMKEHLLNAAKYWIDEYDIDGWRLDVSDEVSHKFWREFRNSVKSSKEDAYIIGENWANSTPWLMGDQYDGVMNYELLFPLWNYFGTNIDKNQYTSTEFKFKVNQVLTTYPKNVLKSLYNLVDSHDTTRILEICSNDINLVKLPYLFMFSFPGAPSIYYGGEIGLTGKHDPDNRHCMEWNEDKQDKDIQSHIKKLIELRNNNYAFKHHSIKWLETNDNEEYIIYQKQDLYFLISKRYKENNIVLPKELQNQTFEDIYHNKTVKTGENIVIPSYGFYILKK
ncbi:Neopullulanase [Candidatus Izimaplasma bacterium HR1]|jgi:glycosidase|uniref:glycoside hydrolase family 13 protein n=1 Tax=Candidatus Izimoplasma sp. HR1 TaxID=1541959 RepID=UPI0004F59967|nr:Neopullulanase [Candidatus Izimaplasma bacterium HR1]